MTLARKYKLAIVATHPVQYHVPWFRALAGHERVALKVFYLSLPDSRVQGVGFDVPFQWDIPLLDGYDWETLRNSDGTMGIAGVRPGTFLHFVKAFQRGAFDAVITTGWHALPLVQAVWACKQLKIPCFVRAESNSMHRRPIWIRWIHHALLHQYDGFLAIGKKNEEFYLLNGARPERIFPCPYLVDAERIEKAFNATASHRATFRAKWGIPSGDVCFLFAGKLVEKKRVFDLLAAFASAHKSASQISLLIVGTGKLMGRARRWVKQHRLRANFTGFLNQTEMIHAYVATDCLVLPSDYSETWGVVVNEAMACGLPAVVSDRVGCGPDLVRDRVTGRTFPFGEVKALASILVELAEKPSSLKAMGKAARRHIASYSTKEAVEGTLAALDSILDSRSRN
jgi:glycosyltransferase involved in cell wall biosynthesis